MFNFEKRPLRRFYPISASLPLILLTLNAIAKIISEIGRLLVAIEFLRFLKGHLGKMVGNVAQMLTLYWKVSRVVLRFLSYQITPIFLYF